MKPVPEQSTASAENIEAMSIIREVRESGAFLLLQNEGIAAFRASLIPDELLARLRRNKEPVARVLKRMMVGSLL